MFEKRSQFTVIPVEVMHNPDFKTTKSAYVKPIQLKVAETKEAVTIKDGLASFDLEAEVKEHPDFLFVKCFAIKANETNDNGDWFSTDELKKAYHTFIGCPIFVNHQNNDVEKARGKVVHSWYDDDRDGIMIIARVDAVAYPHLARGIKEKYTISTSMGCFLGDNRVLLANGTYCPIQDIQPGDMVITHKGNVKPVVNVQRHVDKENDYILHININGIRDTIDCTKDHPFLVTKRQRTCACGCGQSIREDPKGDWKRSFQKRMLKGHYQMTDLKIADLQSQFEYEWKRAEDLKIGDMLLSPRLKNKNRTITERQARLIGFFLAEGSFLKYKGKITSVEFSLSIHEKDTLGKTIFDLLNEEFGHLRKPLTYERPNKNNFIVRVNNKHVANWFKKHCGEYAWNKKISDEVMRSDCEIFKIILGAFTAGDGHLRCIGSLQNYNIWTTSKNLQEQFSVMLHSVGIMHSTTVLVNQKASTLRKAVGLETVTTDHLGTGIRRPSYCIQIGSIASNLLSDYVDHKHITHACDKNRHFVSDDYVLRKINNITSTYNTDPVYTLEVEDDHSYIVEGVSVKNCQVMHSICSICHNCSARPQDYCGHIREHKHKKLSGKFECQYHVNGAEKECPLCGSKKNEKKEIIADNVEVHEKNFGLRFIENSFVVSPACHSCGVTEIIDTSEFLKKVAYINARLPGLLKAASTHSLMCTDQSCITLINQDDVNAYTQTLNVLNKAASSINDIDNCQKLHTNLEKISSNLESLTKYAGAQEIKDLRQAIDLISRVIKTIVDQRANVDLEFGSDLMKSLAELAESTDELESQGFGRLQTPDATGTQPPGAEATTTQATPSTPIPAAAPASGDNPQSGITTGPAGSVGTVTGPLASNAFSNLKMGKKIDVGLKIAKKKRLKFK